LSEYRDQSLCKNPLCGAEDSMAEEAAAGPSWSGGVKMGGRRVKSDTAVLENSATGMT
jgi:hypothetical protein